MQLYKENEKTPQMIDGTQNRRKDSILCQSGIKIIRHYVIGKNAMIGHQEKCMRKYTTYQFSISYAGYKK